MYVLVLLSRASTTIVFSYFYSTFKKIAQQVMNIACAPLFASTNPWNTVRPHFTDLGNTRSTHHISHILDMRTSMRTRLFYIKLQQPSKTLKQPQRILKASLKIRKLLHQFNKHLYTIKNAQI